LQAKTRDELQKLRAGHVLHLLDTDSVLEPAAGLSAHTRHGRHLLPDGSPGCVVHGLRAIHGLYLHQTDISGYHLLRGQRPDH